MVLRQTLDSACRVRSVLVKLFSCCHHMGGRAVGESRAECCHMGVAVKFRARIWNQRMECL